MKVIVTEPVQIALQLASEDVRRRVRAWIENLERWETDPYLQQQSKKLNADDNVYMLVTSTDFLIFFALDKDTITILDVARKAAIAGSGLS